MKHKRMRRAIRLALLLAALLTVTVMAEAVQATVPQLDAPVLGQWSDAVIGWTEVDEATFYNVELCHAETIGGTLTKVNGITQTQNEYTVPRTAHETYGITAQLCLRPSPKLLPHPCSYKRGKYTGCCSEAGELADFCC